MLMKFLPQLLTVLIFLCLGSFSKFSFCLFVGRHMSKMPSGKKHSKKPEYTRFTQQELPALKPILTPGWVIGSLVLVGIIFMPIGLASLKAVEHVVEVQDRYDQECVPAEFKNDGVAYIKSMRSNKTCIKRLTVPKKMKSPIYIYYELHSYYQNYRRYVKSRCDIQYRSRDNEREPESKQCDCEPEKQIGDNPIVPCGLIAWSLFNDTYSFSVNNRVLEVNKKDISWGSDRNHKFGSNVYPKNFQTRDLIGGGKLNESIPLNQQENLIVWMRTAPLPHFRKLYGKINVDLEANDHIDVVIQNNYNSYIYGGKKKLVLSTISIIGGKNDFLPVAYLVIGGLSLFLATIFIALYVIKPRPLGDPAYLSWSKNPSGF